MSATPANTDRTTFRMGDRVVHAAKPEWGVGVVSTSASTTHEGAPCQRLTIRFDRAGLKTVSTGIAEIRPAGDRIGTVPERDEPSVETPRNPILDADPAEARRIMTAIPERARDPFANDATRLRETLKLYRFTGSGGSLVEWAVLQSGLSDPLSRFSRHELEDSFSLFTRALDAHLAKQVKAAGSIPRQELVEIARTAPERGQQALRRIHRSR